ncbi:MAG: DUF3426 domain-containing protein [Betaproteobacteria bacterium]|nr:DUF3426 domain-containing protein [Betaproteobacteria bacterium]
MHVFDAKTQLGGSLTEIQQAEHSVKSDTEKNSINKASVLAHETKKFPPQAEEAASESEANSPFGLMNLAYGAVAPHPAPASPAENMKLPPAHTHPQWAWRSAVFFLFMAAMLQSTYYSRDQIASAAPKIKPYLELACKHLNCSIRLPQHIELIVFDDSNIQEDETYSGLMQLSCTLINKASFVQAYPNLELTLTNTDDEAILRKVFTPKEYLTTDKDISAGFSAEDEIKIKLPFTTLDTPVVGYRLFVTY